MHSYEDLETELLVTSQVLIIRLDCTNENNIVLISQGKIGGGILISIVPCLKGVMRIYNIFQLAFLNSVKNCALIGINSE